MPDAQLRITVQPGTCVAAAHAQRGDAADVHLVRRRRGAAEDHLVELVGRERLAQQQCAAGGGGEVGRRERTGPVARLEERRARAVDDVDRLVHRVLSAGRASCAARGAAAAASRRRVARDGTGCRRSAVAEVRPAEVVDADHARDERRAARAQRSRSSARDRRPRRRRASASASASARRRGSVASTRPSLHRRAQLRLDRLAPRSSRASARSISATGVVVARRRGTCRRSGGRASPTARSAAARPRGRAGRTARRTAGRAGTRRSARSSR